MTRPAPSQWGARLLRRPLGAEAVRRWLFFAGVLSLSLGGIGGSFQPSRLILLLALTLLLAGSGSVALVRGAGPVYSAYLAILTLGVITLPLTEDLAAGVSLIVTVALGMCAVLLVDRRPMVADARRVRDAWSSGLLVTLPFATYEIVTGNHFAFALEQRHAGAEIGELPFASIFFGNYNNYSTYTCLAYPMLLGALLDKSSVVRRLMLLCGAAVCVAVTLINTSRIAMLFVAFATVASVFSGHRRSRLWLVALGAGAFLGVRASGFNWQYAQQRLTSGLLVDEQRLGLTIAGIDALTRTFGLGLGPGGFVAFIEGHYPQLIPNPHNILMEFAVNFSLLSAFVFVALLGFLFIRTARHPALPPSVRFPLLVTIPFVPLIGSINSLAVGYTYWWYWFASAVFMIAANGGLRGRYNRRAGRRSGGVAAWAPADERSGHAVPLSTACEPARPVTATDV